MSKNTKMTVMVEAYQVVEKTVAKMTPSSGRIYLPKDWVGKRVKVFLMEEPDEEPIEK